VPSALPNNTEWGFDTTTLRDATEKGHIVLGLVDHGSRLNLMLRAIPRFNAWTLLGYPFLAIGRYGKPSAIRFDNHPVHRAKKVNAVLRWAGIRPRFIRLASPWQDGRIERFFGTLKSHLGNMRFAEARQLEVGLAAFRVYYNNVRGHQHLAGEPRPKRGTVLIRTDARRDGWSGTRAGAVACAVGSCSTSRPPATTDRQRTTAPPNGRRSVQLGSETGISWDSPSSDRKLDRSTVEGLPISQTSTTFPVATRKSCCRP
jgi:hypothetical protein